MLQKENCQSPSVLYFVAENPLYRGRWWTDGGHNLWATYAPDEVDNCFYIPQETFLSFLVLAQRLPEWIANHEMPIFWEEARE
jgi:hypothetical protein